MRWLRSIRLNWGLRPQTPGIYRLRARMAYCGGGRSRLLPFRLLNRRSGCVPALPYPPLRYFQSGSHQPRRAMIFHRAATNPLNFLSHWRGSPHLNHVPACPFPFPFLTFRCRFFAGPFPLFFFLFFSILALLLFTFEPLGSAQAASIWHSPKRDRLWKYHTVITDLIAEPGATLLTGLESTSVIPALTAVPDGSYLPATTGPPCPPVPSRSNRSVRCSRFCLAFYSAFPPQAEAPSTNS